MNKVTDEEWPSFAAYWYIDFVKNRISRLRGAEKPLCWLTGVGENIVSINMVNKRSAVQDIWGGKAALQSMLRLNLKHKGLIISLQSIFARALANGFWYIDDENIIRARKHLDENAAEIIIPIPETYPPKPLLKAVAMKEEHKKMIRAIRYFDGKKKELRIPDEVKKFWRERVMACEAATEGVEGAPEVLRTLSVGGSGLQDGAAAADGATEGAEATKAEEAAEKVAVEGEPASAAVAE